MSKEYDVVEEVIEEYDEGGNVISRKISSVLNQNADAMEAEINEEENTTEESLPNDYGEIVDGNLKALAALSYVWIFFLIPLLVKRDSPFVQLHAKQGMIITLFFFLMSWILWFERLWLSGLFRLTWLVIAIIGIVQAVRGEYFKFPVTGDIADKWDFSESKKSNKSGE